MRAATAGLVVSLVTYTALSSGAVPTVGACVALVLLISMLPVDPSLTRRWACAGAIVIGWVPMTWWLPLPSDLNRGAIVAALAAGWLAMTVAGSTRPGRRLREVLPALSLTDLWIVAAGLTAFATMYRWITASSPAGALATMLSGYDNAAHFDMFSMLRRHGTTIEALGAAPDGSAWTYGTYPQGFHALTATFAGLTEPHVSTGPAELVTYTQAVGTVVVLATMVLVAAVCSLPALQRRPLAALPLVSLICTAYMWEPGAKMLANGFANFWLAAAATSCAIVLALDLRERPSVIGVAGTSGALVCGVNCWAPLVILAMPACVILCQVTFQALTSSARRRHAVVYAVIGFTAAMCALKTLLTLVGSVDPQTLVTASGGISRTSAVPTFALLGICAFVRLALRHTVRTMRHERRAVLEPLIRSMRLLGLTPLLGLATLSALLVAQVRTAGTSSYYLLKFLIGFELVLAALAGTMLALVLVNVTRPLGRRAGIALSCVAAATATQFFGHVSWGDGPMVGELAAGVHADGTTPTDTALADEIVSASSSTTPAKALNQVYVVLGEQRGSSGLLPALWFQAISNSLTTETAARLAPLDRSFRDRDDASTVIRSLLTSSADLSVVVAPSLVEPLRQMVPRGVRPQVTSWDAPRISPRP